MGAVSESQNNTTFKYIAYGMCISFFALIYTFMNNLSTSPFMEPPLTKTFKSNYIFSFTNSLSTPGISLLNIDIPLNIRTSFEKQFIFLEYVKFKYLV